MAIHGLFLSQFAIPVPVAPSLRQSGSWSDWEFQAMQRVGPKETMDERNDSSSYVMGVCKLVSIFMYLYTYSIHII
jgi:hypothetical protein